MGGLLESGGMYSYSRSIALRCAKGATVMYPLPYLTVHHLARRDFIRGCLCFLISHFLPSSFLYAGERE